MLKGLHNVTEKVLDTFDHTNTQITPYIPPLQQGFGTGSMATTTQDTLQNGSCQIPDSIINTAIQTTLQTTQALLDELGTLTKDFEKIAVENPVITGSLLFASTLGATYVAYRCCSNRTAKVKLEDSKDSNSNSSVDEDSVEENEKDPNVKKTKKKNKNI